MSVGGVGVGVLPVGLGLAASVAAAAFKAARIGSGLGFELFAGVLSLVSFLGAASGVGVGVLVLAVVGAGGVLAVLCAFAALWPEKFCNVTNGVNPRRFVALGNPALTKLITERIGDGWLYELNELRKLEPFATDPAFQSRWREAKLENKQKLAQMIEAGTGIQVNPQTIFDILVKRIHEYKRQHLFVLYILTLYLRLKHDPQADFPRHQRHAHRAIADAEDGRPAARDARHRLHRPLLHPRLRRHAPA